MKFMAASIIDLAGASQTPVFPQTIHLSVIAASVGLIRA
jgi:hypothetical protein